MSRSTRTPPLPELQPVRVEDSKTQRAFDMLLGVLRAVLQLLQPFAQQQPWRALPLFSDWGRGSTASKLAQYTVDPLGRVELRGEAKTVAGTVTTIAVLPEGFRPHVGQSFPVTVYNAGIVPGRVDIQSNGRVVLVEPVVAANIEVYLDGLRFDTRE